MNTTDGSTPSVAATDACTSRASASPCSPVATLAFWAMVTMARPARVAATSRLIATLGPAKVDLVNAAEDTAGPSDAITLKSGESERRPILATIVENPRGTGTFIGGVLARRRLQETGTGWSSGS